MMKKIIEFYTKAKAYKQLAMFYDACSQLEIDEFRDYEKVRGLKLYEALYEALSCMRP